MGKYEDKLRWKKRLRRKIADRKKYSSASLEEQANKLLEAQQRKIDIEKQWENLDSILKS